MADPYRRYGAPADRAGSIPGSSFPGYLSTDPSLSAAHINDLHGFFFRLSTQEYLFRPFIGFKEIRVVHKETRRKGRVEEAKHALKSGDKAMVLCFVEFSDARCSRTALEALQGYKFDVKKPDSPTLRIQFAHFPVRLPSVIPRKPTI